MKTLSVQFANIRKKKLAECLREASRRLNTRFKVRPRSNSCVEDVFGRAMGISCLDISIPCWEQD